MPTSVSKGQLTLTDMNDVVASATAPSNPTEGALWWDGKDLKVYQNGKWNISADYATYVNSRGENLVTNGTGLFGNNYNFSALKFEGVDSYYSNGSFTTGTNFLTVLSDELMPVNPDLTYKMSYFIKANPYVGAKAFGMVACFDADGLQISPNHTMYRANTLTTLAQDLKAGDTVVYLTSASNWINSAGTSTHMRGFTFWNYTNSFGYTFPELTYSRNSFLNMYDDGAVNYTNNTITLKTAWTGATIPAGTKVSNSDSGGTYKYISGSNFVIPQSWTNYSGTIGGVDFSGTNVTNKFHPATASVKIGWLLNRDVTGGKSWLSNISFNVDVASQSSVDKINETLGNMANDNIIDYSERKVIKDRLTDILGYVLPNKNNIINYAGKVTASTTANPHISRYSTGALITTATAGTEHSQADYDKIKASDSSTLTTSTTVNGAYAQHSFSFDLIAFYERNYGAIPATTLATKVAWLKTMVAKFIFTYYGKGTSATGNKVSTAMWDSTTNAWHISKATSTSSGITAVLWTISNGTLIDANGFVHLIAYADPSNGTVASVIETDYINLSIDWAKMPASTTLDGYAYGGFYNVRRSAINAGISTGHANYVAVATEYTNLKTYLEAFTTVYMWDVDVINKDNVITVDKAVFRDKWLKYYTAVNNLATLTAQQLKSNVDNVTIGGTNYASNGDFSIVLANARWKNSYVGNLTEIVDISTETPPHKYALHVKNTSNTNGGIFSPVLWGLAEADGLRNKVLAVSFWLKYSGITQGANSYNLGRFGEIVVEGETSTGSKVYSYTRVHTNNTATTTSYVSGTNTTWTKYSALITLSLPTNAVKLTNIIFKHGLEGCTGEFWTTGLKVEVGNKVTDWSESPLDIQDRLTNVEFKITDDRIVSTVTSSGRVASVDDLNKMSTANLLRDSMFERVGIDVWDYTSPLNVTKDANEKYEGSNTIKISNTGYTASQFEGLFTWDRVLPINGRYSTFSVYVMTKDKSALNGKIRLYMKYNDESGNPIATSSFKDILPADLTNGVWQRFYVNADMPSNANHGTPEVLLYGSGTVWVSRPMLQLGNALPAPWVLHVEDMATNFKSQIEQTSNKVSIVVGSDNKIKGSEVVSAINVEPSTIKISSKNIDLNGVVTIANAGESPNLFRGGFDSFEQISSPNSLPSPMTVQSGTLNYAYVADNAGMGGSKGLALSVVDGTYIRFNLAHTVEPSKKYFVSFYFKGAQDYIVTLDIINNNGVTSEVLRGTHLGGGWQRVSGDFLTTSYSVDFRLGVFEAGGDEVYFDHFMLEEAHPEQTVASPFKPASATIINGDNITTGTIDANKVKVTNLVVGTNVSMGSNAYISWGNITSKPTIPNGTYIDANGVYTGTVRAENISAGTISSVTLTSVSINSGTINIDTEATVGTTLYIGKDFQSGLTKAIRFNGTLGASGIFFYPNYDMLEFVALNTISFDVSEIDFGNASIKNFNGGIAKFG